MNTLKGGTTCTLVRSEYTLFSSMTFVGSHLLSPTDQYGSVDEQVFETRSSSAERYISLLFDSFDAIGFSQGLY